MKASNRRLMKYAITSMALMCCCRVVGTALAEEVAPARDALKQQVHVDIKPQPLRKAVEGLLDKRGIPWIVDDDVRPLLDNARAEELRLPQSIMVKSVLRLMLGRHGLNFVCDGILVMIVSEERALREVTDRVYNLDDLVAQNLPLEKIMPHIGMCCSWPAGSLIQLISPREVKVRNEVSNQDRIADELQHLRLQVEPNELKYAEHWDCR